MATPTTTSNGHTLIIGAGIVGAACALELAEAGETVTIADAAFAAAGATAECMGHLVVMDDSEAQIALTSLSVRLWETRASDLPASVEYDRCGTIWVAADDEEMAAVTVKCEVYHRHGVEAEVLGPDALYRYEPNLRRGLAGGLRVPGDRVLYAPTATRWMLDRALATGRCRYLSGARALRIDGHAVYFEGATGPIRFDRIVVAAGIGTSALLPELEIRPRKGMLAITDRYPGYLRHQLVELGYLKSAHGSDEDSVAFNVQPRFTGQILIGSSRQFGRDDRAIDQPLLRRMLARAAQYLPSLDALRIIRVWSGFRPAGRHHLPLIGPHPGRPGVWLATGHEGLGITTSLGTARLLADGILGRPSPIAPTPFLPANEVADVRYE